MHRRLALFATFATFVGLVHCAATPPPPQAAVSIPQGGSATLDPVASHPVEAGFPGGPGTTLLADDLSEAFRDRNISDGRVPQVERVAAAERVLGTKAIRDDQDFVFVGVLGRNILGPFGCRELRIGPMQSSEGPTDHARCGLPYVSKPNAPAFDGPGTSMSFRLLQRAASWQDFAHFKTLGKAEVDANGALTFFAVGARTAEAPISCHALHADASGARLETVPLSRCGITWPPAADAFARGPQPTVPLRDEIDRCSTCDASEVCVLDERVPHGSRVTTTEGRASAAFLDGRPAAIELSRACAPRPPTCTTLTRACLSANGGGLCGGDGVFAVEAVSGPTHSHVLCKRWSD